MKPPPLGARSLGLWFSLLAGLTACPSFERMAVPNGRPRADAGSDKEVEAPAQVVLTGRGEDPEGDPLTYRWAQLSGDVVELSSATTPETTFSAPARTQTLLFALTVNDGIDASEPDLIQVRVVFNRPPVADAGGAQSVLNLRPLLLSGSALDPDGDAIRAYQWAVESGPSSELGALLSGAESKYAVFTPDKKGQYSLSLVASDGKAQSEKEYLIVTALNNPPEADAGPDRSGPNLRPIALEGAAQDADGDPVHSWLWEVLSFPPGATFSLVDAGAKTATFTPRGKGTYLLGLVVSDEEEDSKPSEVLVQAENNPPISGAGPDLAVANLGRVSLQGSAFDPDGDAPMFQWAVTSIACRSQACGYALTGAATPNPLLEVHGKGDYVLNLSASDGTSEHQDTAVVTALNNAPIADAGPDITSATAGRSVTLYGSASRDPDGDALTSYAWRLLPAGEVTLTGAAPAFVTPAGARATYLFELVVRDDDGGRSAPDLVQVVVDNLPPIADAGPAVRYEEAGTEVTLDGTLSRDPDGSPITVYQWAQIAGPQVILSSASSARPSFVSPPYDPRNPAALKFSLRVNDGQEWSEPSEVVVHITPDSASYVFVSATSGLEANPGTRAAPKASIAAGIAAAYPGKDVVVAAGAAPYSELFELKNGVSVYGGFRAGTWERDVAGNETIIEDVCCRDFVIHAGEDITAPTVFDGFTVRKVNNGSGQWLGALRCYQCSNLTVSRCRFVGVKGDLGGGSIGYLVDIERGSAVRVEKSILESTVKSYTYKYGVWIHENLGSIEVVGNRILVQGAYAEGWGVYLDRTTGVVVDGNEIAVLDATGCQYSAIGVHGHDARQSGITNNVLKMQGATCAHFGVVMDGCAHDLNMIANNVISGSPNGAAWKEGVHLSRNGTSATLVANNFIHDVDVGVNEGDWGSSQMVFCRPASMFPLLRANAFSAAATLVHDVSSAGAEVSTSDLTVVNGGLDKKSPSDPDNAGNLIAECALVDEAGTDYRLTPTSPCVDRGDRLAGVPTRDYFGNPRPIDRDGASDLADGTDIGVCELPR